MSDAHLRVPQPIQARFDLSVDSIQANQPDEWEDPKISRQRDEARYGPNAPPCRVILPDYLPEPKQKRRTSRTRVATKRLFEDASACWTDDDWKQHEKDSFVVASKKAKTDSTSVVDSVGPVGVPLPPTVSIDSVGTPGVSLPLDTTPPLPTVVLDPKPSDENRIKIGHFKIGEIVSTVIHMKINSVAGDKQFTAEHLRDERVPGSINRNWLYTVQNNGEFACHSSIKYDTIEKLNKTDLVAKFLQCNVDAFTVEYETKLDERDMPAKLNGERFALLQAIGIVDEAERLKQMKQVVSDIHQENKRTTVGRMIATDHSTACLGYTLIDDLEAVNATAEHKPNIRSVNHRTITSLIYHNVKYELKKK